MGQGHGYYKNSQSASPMPSTLTLPLSRRAMLLVFLKRSLKNISHVIMRNLLRVIPPILNLLKYITLILMVRTCPTTQYPINISSILGIWETKFPIPQIDTELMVGCRFTMKGDESLCLRAFPKENLILAHYILSAWWLHLMEIMVHYVVQPGEIE